MVEQRKWSPEEVERYCLGLIVEEIGEALQSAGQSLRFGIDTPGADGERGRDALQRELGDVWGAIEFAILHGVLHGPAIIQAKQRKINKLCLRDARDNIGRQLAPPLA